MRFKFIFSLIVSICIIPMSVMAGNVNPPATAPSAGSGRYTMNDLYNYLMHGVSAVVSPVFLKPSAGPASSMKTTNEIYDDIESQFGECDATPDKVLDTVLFFSTDPASWGIQAGTLASQMPVDTTVNQSSGIYDAFDLSLVDTDLTASNIKNGVEIFGVAGTVAAATGDAVAADVLAGKTFSNGSVGVGISGAIPGTMADYSGTSAKTYTPATSDVTIDAGYHDSSKVAGDVDLVAGNIKSGVTIFGQDGSLEPPTGDAIAADVLTGKTFSNGVGVGIAGSMAIGNNVPGINGQLVITIPDGYYESKTATVADTNLIAGNIRQTVTVFGVLGDTNVADTSSGDAVAGDIAIGKKAWVDGSEIIGTAVGGPALPKTGQTASYAEGDDGDLQRGLTWPSPRFTDNGDGTITDNLTGLIWLKLANCFSWRSWLDALSDCNTLADGTCGLTDGSAAGDWRLPNIKELISLVDFGQLSPNIPSGHPFTNVQSEYYWSSSTTTLDSGKAWIVDIGIGNVIGDAKTNTFDLWPVRGGL